MRVVFRSFFCVDKRTTGTRITMQNNLFACEILKLQNEIGKSKKCIFASLFLMNDGQENGRIL